MSLDLNSVLDLPASLDRTNFTLITSDDLNNSSFLFHSLIQSKVKSIRSLTQQSNQCNNSSVCLKPQLIVVCLNQSFSHYSSVAAKSFGLNLKSLREGSDPLLQVLDMVKDFPDYTNNDPDAPLQTIDSCFSTDKFESCLLNLISCTSRQRVGTNNSSTTSQESVLPLQKQSSITKPLVMIDDVRVLSSLGIASERIYLLLQRIRSICCLNECSLIVQSHIDPSHEINDQQEEESRFMDHERDEESDPSYRRLLSSLVSTADLWIDCCKLKTGYSDKIDGFLYLYDYQRDTSNDREANDSKGIPVKYLFKTMERNTRIYAPGSVLM